MWKVVKWTVVKRVLPVLGCTYTAYLAWSTIVHQTQGFRNEPRSTLATSELTDHCDIRMKYSVRLWDEWVLSCGYVEARERSSTNLLPQYLPRVVTLPRYYTDYTILAHGVGWQFPQRKNKICGNTKTIAIKMLHQIPLRFPRKASRYRMEVNSGLSKSRCLARLWATAFWMSGRDSLASVQCRERRWRRPATSVLRTVLKNVFHWQTTPSALLTNAHLDRHRTEKSDRKLMPKAMAMIQRLA
jgi:hypothetical protein